MEANELRRAVIAVVLAAGCALCCAETKPAADTAAQQAYARSRLAGAGKTAELRIVEDLGHREAFRVRAEEGKTVIEAATGAGLIYGAQSVACQGDRPGEVEKPDFDIRGTTLWLGGAVQGRRIAPYHSGFHSGTLPWLFDRAFMTRYLDKLASARFNTLFLWASHPFPYLLDLPEYPAATRLLPAQLAENQQQFRWLVSQCERRNIRVLLHFYNIHLPDGLREQFGGHASWGASAVKNPSPEIAEYYRYVLGRYFEEFDNVGLYICPGETLATSRQLEWFRDVIFKAAKESGKNSLLIIRDWTLNINFREQIPALYENCYSELKHNDETFTSPVPDRRHKQWRDLLKGHVVNLHGPPMDLQPMRWASPLWTHETVTNWRHMGYVKGAEIYALSCFDWPYTQDKLAPDQFGYRAQVKGPKLLWIDRSGIYLDVFGRYLWKAARTPEDERDHWEQHLTEKFHSTEVGKHLYRWYVVTGPISPGMQNLTATKFGNFWATVMLQNLGSEFLRHMQQSVEVYEDLAQLTDRTYRNANDLMGRHWRQEGLTEFRNDLATQRAWLAALKQPKSVTLPGGAVRIEAEAMAGPWRIGNDRYTGFSGTGYAASYYAAVRPNPEPMTAKVHIPKAGEYTVWVRALVGGSHQDRALAVEVADQRLEPTHTARGSAEGVFLWERAGEMKLPTGAAVLRIHPVGKGHPTADAVLLTPDANWKPQDDGPQNKPHGNDK